MAIFLRRRHLFYLLLALTGCFLVLSGYNAWEGKINPVFSPLNRSGGIQVKPLPETTGAPPAAGSSANGTMASGGQQSATRTSEDKNAEQQDFFVDYRLQKEQARSHQLAVWREVAGDQAAAPEVRRQAQEKMLALSQRISREADLENILRARGYRNVVVSIEDNSATVLLQANSLPPEEIAQISTIVSRCTGLERDKIMVFNKYY